MIRNLPTTLLDSHVRWKLFGFIATYEKIHILDECNKFERYYISTHLVWLAFPYSFFTIIYHSWQNERNYGSGTQEWSSIMDKKYYSDVPKGSKVFNPNNAFPDFLCVSKMKVIKEDRSISSFLDIYLLTLFEAWRYSPPSTPYHT